MQGTNDEDGFNKLVSIWVCALSTVSRNVFGPDSPHVFMEAGHIALEKLKDEGVDVMKDTPLATINAIYSYFTGRGYFREARASMMEGELFQGKHEVLRLREKRRLDFNDCPAAKGAESDPNGAQTCFCLNLIRYALFSKFARDLKFLEVIHDDTGGVTVKAALVPASKEAVASGRIVEELGRRGAELQKVSGDFARAINMSLDAIISADEDGRIMLWNAAAERIFGYSQEEALGASIEILVPPEYIEKHRAGMKRLKDTGEGALIGKVVQVKALRKDGVRFPAEISLNADNTGGRWVFTALVRDITGRKRLEDDLGDKLDHMERLNRLMVGRELKMEELRKEIRELRAETTKSKGDAADDIAD